MKPRLNLHNNRISQKAFCRSMPVRLAVLGLAVAFTASQNPAQNLLGSDNAAPAHAASTGPAVTAAPATTDVSAPLPNIDEAALMKPSSDSLFSLAVTQDSQSSLATSNPPTAPAAKKPKPPHHGLGVALSDIGIGALAAGIILYAGESHFCGSNTTIKDCNSARDAGLGLMPAGGALIVTGFILRFHR